MGIAFKTGVERVYDLRKDMISCDSFSNMTLTRDWLREKRWGTNGSMRTQYRPESKSRWGAFVLFSFCMADGGNGGFCTRVLHVVGFAVCSIPVQYSWDSPELFPRRTISVSWPSPTTSNQPQASCVEKSTRTAHDRRIGSGFVPDFDTLLW